MKRDPFTVRVFPPSLLTPANRLAFILDLLNPVDPVTGEALPPLLSQEDALSLLDCPATAPPEDD